MRVGVIGATGQAGSAMVAVLEERSFPVEELCLFASAASEGKKVEFRGEAIKVHDAATADYRGLDIVLMAAGAPASRELAPRIAATGAIVIDNSSAWRMDPDVPLVVPEVNRDALRAIPKGIVANPNCTTMVAMPVLKPLHDAAGLVALVVATYQAASGAGRAGVAELAAQLARTAADASVLATDGAALDFGDQSTFGAPLAHNVIPLAGTLEAHDGDTSEERKYRDESRKILSIPTLRVSCTCVRVPVFTGHGAAITASFEREISPTEALDLLGRAPAVVVHAAPTPLNAAGGDPSLVGRVRATDAVEHGLSMFVVGDNLRKGAALNAVQIAEALDAG